MLTKLQLGGYELEFDRDATAVCYARVQVPGPEECGCAYCRNWVAAREQVLPTEFRNMLMQFGIPHNGEIEVWEATGKTQPHFYGGWYFVVGRILGGEPRHTFDLGAFQVYFAEKQSYAVAEFAGHPICELHFMTEIAEYLPESEYAAAPKPVVRSVP